MTVQKSSTWPKSRGIREQPKEGETVKEALVLLSVSDVRWLEQLTTTGVMTGMMSERFCSLRYA